jgi:hypothetical protein
MAGRGAGGSPRLLMARRVDEDESLIHAFG